MGSLANTNEHPRSGLRSEGHPFLLNQLLNLLGGCDLPPNAYSFLLGSRMRALLRLTLHLRSVLAAFRSTSKQVVLSTLNADLLSTLVVVSDDHIRSRILTGALLLRPFLVISTSRPQPVRHVCALLGIDPADELVTAVSVNALLVFFGHANGIPVVVHLSTTPVGNEALQRHRTGLVASSTYLNPSLLALAPKLVASYTLDSGFQILMQTKLSGEPWHSSKEPGRLFYSGINNAFKPLLHFPSTACHSGDGPDENLLFVKFPALRERYPVLDVLEPLLASMQAWQRNRCLTPVLVHGDYWLRNVLFDPASGETTGIVDWERSRPCGTPGLDALHLALMSLAMEFNRDILEYLCQAWTGRWDSEALASYVSNIQIAFGLTSEDIGHLAGMLYFDELLKQADPCGVIAFERVQKMRSVQPVIASWLANLSAYASKLPKAEPVNHA